MAGEHILRFTLMTPEFFMRNKDVDYKKEYPLDLNFVDHTDGSLRFGFNNFGLEIRLTPMIPTGFSPWLIEDMKGIEKRYLSQAVSPSFQFLRESIAESGEGLNKLREYIKMRGPSNGWFGLQDTLDFENHDNMWRLLDYFYLGRNRGGTLTKELLNFREIPAKGLSKQMKKYQDLAMHITPSREERSSNYFEQSSIKECVDTAVLVYEVAEDFRH